MNELNRIIPNSDGRTESDNLRMFYNDEDLKAMGVLEKIKKADQTRDKDINEQLDNKEENLKEKYGEEVEFLSPDGEVVVVKTGL